MPAERTYQGQTYRQAAPGEPWVRVGPAPVQVQAGNPIAMPQAQADLQRAQAQAAEASATAPYAGAQAQAELEKARADAAKAQAEAAASAKEQANAPDPGMSKIQQAIKTSALLEALETARGQIGEGWATGNVAGSDTFKSLPFVGQNSTDLAATISGLQGSIINDTLAQLKAQSSSGASGYGSLTESEAQRLAAAVGALQQSQSKESLLNNLARVEKHYRSALALSMGEDPREPAVAEKYGLVTPSDDTAPPRGGLTSEGKFEPDPALAGVNAQVRRMVLGGSSAAEVRQYLDQVQPGLGARTQDLDRAVSEIRQNPNQQINVDLEKQWVPNSGFTKTMGDIGLSPIGSALIGAGDTASLGFLDNMTDNPDMTRAVMEGVSQENPTSYILGQIAGGASSGIGLEAALARGGLSGLRAARAGEALYGAGYGAGSADEPGDSRVANALLGAGAGALGGAVGRGAARTVGRGVEGVNDVAQLLLNRSGVRMTPGQILGGGAKAAEDRLAGFPVVGDAIQARRGEGLEDFNFAVFNQALEPIGGTATGIGQAGVNTNQQAISNAYRDALGSSQVFPDAGFQTDLAGAVGGLRAIPRIGGEVTDTVGEIVNPTYFDPVTEALSGTNMQPMLQELRGVSAAYRTDPLGNRVNTGIGNVEDAITGMFERQAPEVMPAYINANTAYRNQSILDDAVLKALNQGGTFTPAQLGASMRSNTVKFGGKRAAARGDMPFNDLQQAAQEVLPSKIPDSGTAGRIAVPAIAASLAGGGTYATSDGETMERGGTSLGVAGLAALMAAAPYSRTSQAALQRALMAERPEVVRRAGEMLRQNSDIAGLLAAPVAVGAVTE